MKIGQISFFRMSSPVERPYGSPELGSKYQGQSEPTASAFHRDFDDRPEAAAGLTPMAHRTTPSTGGRTSAAGRASRWSRRARSDRTPARSSGRCRGSLWERLVDRRDRPRAPRSSRRSTACWSRRRPGASSSRPASASGSTRSRARCAAYEGTPIVPALRAAGFEPGVRRRRGDEPPPLRPRRRPAARRRRRGPSRGRGSSPSASEWEIALGDNSRARRPPTTSRSCGSSRTGARAGWADGEVELLPGVSVVPTGGHSAGHQAIVVRGGGPGGRTLGVLRRPVHAAVEREPALGHRVRRLPARLGRGEGGAVRAGPPTRAGSSSSPTSRRTPVGRLVRRIGTASASSRPERRRPARAPGRSSRRGRLGVVSATGRRPAGPRTARRPRRGPASPPPSRGRSPRPEPRR